MEKKLAIIIVIITLLYGFYNAKKREVKASTKEFVHNRQIKKHAISDSVEEPKKLDILAYKKQYIIDVINNGSTQLKFKPTEIMDAGFASREDAPKIASYVLALSGKNSATYPKDAPMYYSSNCAGCHGDDAKGVNGTYPNLTRERLLGMTRREVLGSDVIKELK